MSERAPARPLFGSAPRWLVPATLAATTLLGLALRRGARPRPGQVASPPPPSRPRLTAAELQDFPCGECDG